MKAGLLAHAGVLTQRHMIPSFPEWTSQHERILIQVLILGFYAFFKGLFLYRYIRVQNCHQSLKTDMCKLSRI